MSRSEAAVPAASPLAGRAATPAIDGDGDTVAFESTATNLVPSDTNAKEDVFVRRTASATTLRAPVSSGGVQGTSGSNDPSLSSDGNRVGFASTASNLVTGDTNSRNDSFLRDLAAGTTVRTSLTQNGAQANEASSNPWLSGDGLSLSFRPVATNLVPEDTDATPDVYVRGPGSDAAAYAYDRADRITAAGATAITVSAVGATTARGSDVFAYDQANRLRTATVAGTTETLAYDGDGVRFSRQVGAGPVTRYVTDPAASLPVTVDDGTRTYVWGLGLAYAVAGSTLEVYHADRLGSTRALTDASGAVSATYRTDEFGNSTTVTGTSSQPFRYTGEPLDASGLTYLRARYYDPSIGRFMSRDPWAGTTELPPTQNRYGYGLANPTTLSDPSGLCIDPGGPGLRYCIERYIPEASFCYGTVCGNGDDRGPNPARGSFKSQLLIYRNANGTWTSRATPGASLVTGLPFGISAGPSPGTLIDCVPQFKSHALGTTISSMCGAVNGINSALGTIWTYVEIEQTAKGSRVSAAYGSAYPNVEVWEYGGPDRPISLLEYATAWREPVLGLADYYVDYLDGGLIYPGPF